ncbi:MAG: translation initiation factor IF-3 [Elusimicrobiota bacterium]
MNSYIRVPQVRLIDEDGTQVGITAIADALKMAQDKGRDLVEISGASTPPVCKIIDFPKFRYDQEKKEREARKKQKTGGQLKEIRVRVRISDHDLETKLKHAREFLTENNKVQATVVFMGREMQHRDLGMKLLERIYTTLGDISELEQRPNLFGNRLSITLMPKKLVKK